MKKLFYSFCFILFFGCEPSNGFKFTEKKSTEEELSILELSKNKAQLDKKLIKSISIYEGTIRKYSVLYQLDWRLIASVIQQESAFNQYAVSSAGAYGLMQIMPRTSRIISAKINLKETSSPKNNIKAGIFYLKWLYGRFEGVSEEERIKLTLAAYNCGIGRIRSAQAICTYLGYDKNVWSNIEDVLPMLSWQFQDLHDNLGLRVRKLNDWKQTVNYVSSVTSHYNTYKITFS